MLIKLGEATAIGIADIQPTESVLADADLEIEERMRKFAQNLKAIAPMAKDFLYFTCVMMHAAEAALLDDNGEIKKLASGELVTASWESVGKDGIKWVCSDPSIKPYRNSNRDVFPEMELKVAYKKWVGRPLCLDHKSASVDAIRGVIVDTYYDDRGKRVIALCALDKKNYGDLARKVASGYATNVSMGTAVGRAICSEEGCHRVARTESDFCQHMKAKSCYGEINLDLSPLELSIVVSGADSRAKIKHIIAKDLSKAAESLNNYVEGKISIGKVSIAELAEIKSALQDLTGRVESLIKSNDGDENEAPTEASSGQETALPETNQNYSPPVGGISGFAMSDLQRAVLSKLAKLQEDVNQLSSIAKEEPNMTTKNAYYQGTVEPAAGGVKYPPEPGQEARNQDKHMVGAPPFPAVGSVDAQYPGDAETRKGLQRQAEEEQRAIQRQAALEKAKGMIEKRKEAYFQGGGGVNEPTPGKPKYPVDPGQEARNQDKHMVGASPFPGVGKVDGLYGDDMATKEKLSRASLKAAFRKVSAPSGQTDKANSRWDIYADGKLILTATVDQISRGNSDVLFDGIANEGFGKGLLRQLKSEGYEKTAQALTKQAQPAPVTAPAPAAVPGPGMPADEPALPPTPEAGMEAPVDEPPPPVDAEPDPAEVAKRLEEEIAKAHETSSDLVEMLGATQKAEDEIPEGPEAPEEAFDMAEEAGPEMTTTATLQSMRRTINKGFLRDIPNAIKELQAHAHELELTRNIYASKINQLSPKQRQYLAELTAEGVSELRHTLASSRELIGAFIQYAQGTEGLIKRAQCEDNECSVGMAEDGADTNAAPYDQAQTLIEAAGLISFQTGTVVTKEDVEATIDPQFLAGYPSAQDIADAYIFATTGQQKDPSVSAPDAPSPSITEGDDQYRYPVDTGDANAAELTPEQAQTILNAFKNAGQADLTTKEGRAMYRTKLAQKGLVFSDMLNKAHPGAGPQAPNLDIKPSGDLAKVETLEETHKAVMNLATMPPRVRKQAEEIQRLVTAGQLPADKVDELVSHGVDAEAVKYWKQLWNEAKDPKATEFAAKLTQEQAAQKKAKELETEKVRIKRAYDLAYDMRDRGIIEHEQVGGQVEEIMKWNDEGFSSVKNIVAKQPLAKKASMPNVGMLSSSDVILPGAQTQEQMDIQSVLAEHFNGKRF